MDRVQCHYRNGLDGGKDLRSFASLYLYLRVGVFLVAGGLKAIHLVQSKWYAVGFLMLCTAVTVAMIRPYKKEMMNNMDTLLLSTLAMLCFTIKSKHFIFARVLLFIPMVVFLLTLAYQITQRLFKRCSGNSVNVLYDMCSKLLHCCHCPRLHSEAGFTRPLIQPTSTEIGYDTCVSE